MTLGLWAWLVEVHRVFSAVMGVAYAVAKAGPPGQSIALFDPAQCEVAMRHRMSHAWRY